jgi:hypothetical protein
LQLAAANVASLNSACGGAAMLARGDIDVVPERLGVMISASRAGHRTDENRAGVHADSDRQLGAVRRGGHLAAQEAFRPARVMPGRRRHHDWRLNSGQKLAVELDHADVLHRLSAARDVANADSSRAEFSHYLLQGVDKYLLRARVGAISES